MMSRASCSVLRASCVAFCVAVALPVFATTYYVDAEKGDDGYDGTSPDKAVKTFDAAVALLTANGDGLKFAPGTYESSVGFSSKLSSLTFEGTDAGQNPSNVVLSGMHACRLFYLEGDDIAFRNLTVANCRSTDDKHGGALNFPSQGGTSCLLENCVFAFNTNVTANGGAVYSQRPLKVIGCVFESNASENASTGSNKQGRGGGLYTQGNFATHVISNCVFRDNSCIGVSDSGGGGVYCNRDQHSIKVFDTLFENNRSTGGRGGAFRGQFELMTNCTFRGNYAAHAGAIVGSDLDHATLTVDCTFENNKAKGDAGAYSTNGKLGHRFVRCTFDGNEAITGSGGAISGYVFKEITDCTFRNCSATNGSGGAIYGDPQAMRDCVVENCRAMQWGGGWALNPNLTITDPTKPNYVEYMTVTNCIFKGNSICPYRYDGPHSDSGGTGVDLRGFDRFNFYKCQFIENCMTNSLTRNGSTGSYVDDQGNPWPLSKVTGPVYSAALICWGNTQLTECDFIDNYSPSIGAGFYGCSTGGIRRCRFIGNTAYYCGQNGAGNMATAGQGAAISFRYKQTHTVDADGTWRGDHVVEDCAFVSNRVCGVGGSAIMASSGAVSIRRCAFTNNVVTTTNNYDNAGICGTVAFNAQNSYGVDNACKLAQYRIRFRIEDCAFVGNEGMKNGGAITVVDAWQTNLVDGTVVATLGTVRNCLFVTNSCAQRLTTASGNGGAICIGEKPTVAIENCTFVGNDAAQKGGAVYQGSSYNSSVTNCVFYGNTDANAGTSTDDLYLSNNAKLNIGHCFAKSGGQLTDNVNGCIVKDENPFRSDDHTDLAMKKDYGAGVGLPLGWMVGARDLGGKPRLAKDGTVDFGCYQFWRKPGLLLFVQ